MKRSSRGQLVFDKKYRVSFRRVTLETHVSTALIVLFGFSIVTIVFFAFCWQQQQGTTYDQKLVHLDLKLWRSFKWIFVVADIAKPIIGADILR